MARNVITGLRFNEKLLEWTVLSCGKRGVAVENQGSVALEGDFEKARSLAERAEFLRAQCPELAGPVTIGLAPGKMLVRIMEFPTADALEIKDMIQLQADNLFPFSEDRTILSHETLRSSDAAATVLIAATLKEHVESIGELFRGSGVKIERLDAESMGWWRLLCDNRLIPELGRRLTMILEPFGGIWIASQDGLLQAVKAISPLGGLTQEEYAEELSGELGSLIMSLDLERGSAGIKSLDIWSSGVNIEAAQERFGRDLGGNVKTHPLSDLPPLSEGLARRALPLPARNRGKHVVLDLVPPGWRTLESSKTFKRRMVFGLVLALGVWVAALAGFFSGFLFNTLMLKRIGGRLSELQGPSGEAKSLQQQVRSFETYLDRQRSALECLYEISSVLPDDVELISFQFKKGKNISIRGEARAVEPIYDFKKSLDQKKLFKSVDLGSTQPGKRKNITVQTFQMNIRLGENVS